MDTQVVRDDTPQTPQASSSSSDSNSSSNSSSNSRLAAVYSSSERLQQTGMLETAAAAAAETAAAAAAPVRRQPRQPSSSSSDSSSSSSSSSSSNSEDDVFGVDFLNDLFADPKKLQEIEEEDSAAAAAAAAAAAGSPAAGGGGGAAAAAGDDSRGRRTRRDISKKQQQQQRKQKQKQQLQLLQGGEGGDDPLGDDPFGGDLFGDDPLTGDDPRGDDPRGDDPRGDDPRGDDPDPLMGDDDPFKADWALRLKDKDPALAAQAARDLAARREERRLKELEASQQAATLEGIFARAKPVSPGLSFLGVGYDVVKGNPLGDPVVMGDPGLRSPIIQFDYNFNFMNKNSKTDREKDNKSNKIGNRKEGEELGEEDGEGISEKELQDNAQEEEEGEGEEEENKGDLLMNLSSDLRELQPRGTYSRPFVACKQSENLSEVISLTDYVKELEGDASLVGGDTFNLNSFSASAAFKDIAKKTIKKNSRTFLLKTYCLRYEAGLAQTDSFAWNYTLAFKDAVEGLPDTFDGAEEGEGCSPSVWRENSKDNLCINTNIKKWIDFIDQFGTHYVVKLFAGGKLTHQITMANVDIAMMNSKGMSVKSALKATFGVGSVGASTNVEKEEKEKNELKHFNYQMETLVMGGRVPRDVGDPDSLGEWADSVEELPMPVKITLQPLSNLLPQQHKENFEKATRFYSDAVGMTKADLTALAGKPQNIGEILRNSSQVTYAGDPPGFAMCDPHERILFGFAFQVNFLDDGAIAERAEIKSCPAGRDKCDGLERPAKEGDDARIFALCGAETITGLEQVVVQSPLKAVAVCPQGSLILTGFSLSLTGGREGPLRTGFFPCRAGLPTCTALGVRGTQQNMVWVACVEDTTPGLQRLTNVGAAVVGVATKRSYSDGLVRAECPPNLGASFGFTLELHTRMSRVRESFDVCVDSAKNCELKGKGITENIFFRKKDTHALIAFITCSDLPSNNTLMHNE
ncbi:membrane-attack complex / perforin domain-containing protein, putative [Eimeria maxima]|uniref:Membrane-attack complex / perforin domain-containing protein, putative n=1 Tax=Eimeria maxima TaxID=5804 RepID=U6M7I4_EIMMA|nr:membrane-attack complex / perforin domain-containing protein, putative [Eimeria maxima]CDJ59996.1 membrane-attack complex / perforin domain-containing protein, putative [Eimeria maxima]